MNVAYGDLPVIDLAQPDWWRVPAEVTQPMHDAKEAAAYVPGFDTVMFLRYDDCLAGLTDPNLIAMGSRYFEMQGWNEGAFVDWIRLNVVMMNPPGHTRLRKLVNRAFTPRAVAEMRVISQEVARDLCDRVDDNNGIVEFVHDWARVMPLRVVCEMIGIPHVDVDQMADWAARLTEASGVAGPEAREKGDTAMRAFNDYVSAMIAERKASPRDDLLTALINAEEAGDRLTQPELVAMVVQLIFAGHETTQNLLGNGLYRLMENPAHLSALRSDRSLIPNAIEEMLRYDPPILFTSRIAVEATAIAGVPIAADQLVMLNLTAANHDPARFADPARFDVARPDIRHLSFGHGVHFCLGANLARLEADVAFNTLFDRFGKTEWAGDDRSDWTSYTPLRGRQQMPLRLS
jgi:cytochrome P450